MKKVKKFSVEPLKFLLNKYGIDKAEIDCITTGAKYSAIMLKNGKVGVCANFGTEITKTKDDLQNPDLNNLQYRILLTAYFNALLNYSNTYKKEADIFDVVDFKEYKKIIMIGFFKPIIEKFQISKIPLSIFDLRKTNSNLTPMSKQKQYIKKAEAIILTATSIFNNTFTNLVNNTGRNCEIFMLGPSSIMNKELFDYRNIKIIFGAIFEKFDERVLKVIRNGKGTREFLKFGKKIYIKKEQI